MNPDGSYNSTYIKLFEDTVSNSWVIDLSTGSYVAPDGSTQADWTLNFLITEKTVSEVLPAVAGSDGTNTSFTLPLPTGL